MCVSPPLQGHAYVALSRAVDLKRCTLLSFDPTKVKAHPKVKAFYERIEKASALKGNTAAGDGGTSASGAAVSAAGAAAAAPVGGGLSGEQKRRMEENKRRALALRAQRKT